MYENICFNTTGDFLHESRMLDLLHDRAGDSCAQKNEKYIYKIFHKIC